MFKLVVACLLFAAVWAAPTKTQRFINKIVGGAVVYPGELPYQVSIQDITWDTPWHFCGGSVIDNNWVLTAAHCVEGTSAASIQIVAGDHTLYENDGTEQAAKIRKIIVHENFDSWSIKNDIALLKLATPLKQSDYVEAIPLANASHAAGGMCYVSGWGSLYEGGNGPSRLHKVDVPIISDSLCRQQYGSSQIADTMICAGYKQGGKDACQGDSGGPLACSDSGQYQAGVVSWGYGCARPNQAGVYTEVAKFRHWIDNKINAN